MGKPEGPAISFLSLILVVVIPLVGCGPTTASQSLMTDAEVDAAISSAPPQISYRDEVKKVDRLGYEAANWITTNGNFAPFASNQFSSRKQAVEFVRNLYRLGATKIYVVNIMDDPEHIHYEGGPYADALYVYLPADITKRAALFEVEAREARAEGFEPTKDEGQRRLFFWWD